MPKLSFQAGARSTRGWRRWRRSPPASSPSPCPIRSFPGLVEASRLPDFVAAAQPPLGDTARFAAVGAAALFTFAAVWALMAALGRRAGAPRGRGRAGSRGARGCAAPTPIPTLRRAAPLLARDLGEPLELDEVARRAGRSGARLRRGRAPAAPRLPRSPGAGAGARRRSRAEAEAEPHRKPKPDARSRSRRPSRKPSRCRSPSSPPSCPRPSEESDQSLAQLVNRIEFGLSRKRQALPARRPAAGGGGRRQSRKRSATACAARSTTSRRSPPAAPEAAQPSSTVSASRRIRAQPGRRSSATSETSARRWPRSAKSRASRPLRNRPAASSAPSPSSRKASSWRAPLEGDARPAAAAHLLEHEAGKVDEVDADRLQKAVAASVSGGGMASLPARSRPGRDRPWTLASVRRPRLAAAPQLEDEQASRTASQPEPGRPHPGPLQIDLDPAQQRQLHHASPLRISVRDMFYICQEFSYLSRKIPTDMEELWLRPIRARRSSG